jgi:diguanylate cyclase (GGDEF)-like protein
VNQDSLGQAKRRAYLVAHAVTFPTLAAVWAVRAQADGFVRWGYPALAAFLVCTLYGLLSGRISLRRMERSFFAFLSVWALVYLAHSLYGLPGPEKARQELSEGLLPVLASLCVLAHMFFDPKPAARLSAVVLGAAALLAVPAVVGAWGKPESLPLVLSFLRLEAFVVALAVWLYAVALVKDRLAEERVASGTDALTGLLNRRGLYRAFDVEVERARRYGHPLAAILFDLDHFKEVNDHFGHAAGDRLLRAMAQEVRRALRPTDLLGRWGGEEFVVLLPETALQSAVDVAERLRYLVAGLPWETGSLTASFGVAECTATDNLGALLRRADRALYEAKRLGRNRVVPAREGAA